ncbi:MAG: oxygenase MpaB family protein [Deltaproteobacteria bacterium]|nr:oxygenase MpaB family protein [Deltaproteobacteria bacterium]
MHAESPSRFLYPPSVRAQFGERGERLGPWFYRGDPLADAAFASVEALSRPAREALVSALLRDGAAAHPEAPEPLRALVAACEYVPLWVDLDRVDRGGAAFLRTGLLGGMVLGAYALTASYCSPAGNKPLTFSGRLEEQTPRRLAETGRYVQLVAQPGSLRPHGEGWVATVRVRLMHAAVRTMCARSPRWQREAWGVPISQPDMAGTGLLFSLIVIDGMDKLGMPIMGESREDLLHQWRYASWLMGVDQELLTSSEREGHAFWSLLLSTQGEPDEDSRKLVRALLDSGTVNARSAEELARAKRMKPVSYALSRYFLGDSLADALELPKSVWSRVLPAVGRVGRALHNVSGLPSGTVEAGAAYWRMVVDQGLRGTPAEFTIPDRLRGDPHVPSDPPRDHV